MIYIAMADYTLIMSRYDLWYTAESDSKKPVTRRGLIVVKVENDSENEGFRCAPKLSFTYW